MLLFRLLRLFPIAAFVLLISCSSNVFNPTDSKIAKLDADGYIQEGQKRIQEGENEKAMAAFQTARTLDPAKSEAWYGEAKVAYLLGGFNIVVLVNAFQGSASTLPFFNWTTDQQNILYRSTQIARNALIHLVRDTLGSDMAIRPNWVKADYAITIAIHAVLRLKDFNGDGTIDAMDDPIKFLQIRVDSTGVHMVNFDSLVATPQGRAQFNSYLDGTARLIKETYSDIAVFLPQADSAEKYGEVVSELADKITYFKIGDSLDNDGDWWDTDGDGAMDPMVWTDTDQDGRIDLGAGQHLSLLEGSRTNPALYVALNEANYAARPDLWAQWPKANGQPIFTGKVTYVGAPSGEWTSGDFGVDEEDYHGLADADGDIWPNEDSRVGP